MIKADILVYLTILYLLVQLAHFYFTIKCSEESQDEHEELYKQLKKQNKKLKRLEEKVNSLPKTNRRTRR